MKDINDVKKYWEENPLFSLEIESVGAPDFFTKLNKIKREDVERFAMNFWNFSGFIGKKILDVGCGPGWVTVNYALGGADVYSIDLTAKAVELTKKFLAREKVFAKVGQGNAEKLDFESDFFDLVVSSGVLHHTPDFRKAFNECFRVLKPGGVAKITLYHKGFLHNKFIFPFVKFAMKLMNIGRPGASLKDSKNVDDFIRQYDGFNNPVGIGKNFIEWSAELNKAGFVVENFELHFFPRRFIPFYNLMPKFIHCLLDRYFGAMIYFNLLKQIN